MPHTTPRLPAYAARGAGPNLRCDAGSPPLALLQAKAPMRRPSNGLVIAVLALGCPVSVRPWPPHWQISADNAGGAAGTAQANAVCLTT